MKKTTKLIVVMVCNYILLFSTQVGLAQEDEYWTWGGPDEDHGKSIYESNGFLYSYHREFTETDSPDYQLKWDSNGTNILNISSNHSINDITGYMGDIYTCGGFYNENTHSNEVKLSKWDSNWTLIWNKTWSWEPGWKSNSFRDIWTDGSYIFTSGVTEHLSPEYQNWIVVKWDMEGNQIWSGNWGSVSDDSPYSLWSDGDNVYVCGDYNSWRNSALLKLNATGHKNWERTSNDHNLQGVWGDAEGNVYTCGEEDVQNYPNSNEKLVLIKWSSDGEKLWKKDWGKRNYRDRGSIVVGSETNLFTIGKRFHEQTGEMEVVVLKWDFDGKVIAEKFVKYSDRDAVQDVWLSDDYLYLSGYAYNRTENDDGYDKSDCFIMKIPNDFISDKIPGYSIFLILGSSVIGICVLSVKLWKNPATNTRHNY